eukprot:180658_1
MAIKPVTMVIILLGIGYTMAITLVILGCVEDKIYWNLFLLGPFFFTPTMTIFIRSDAEDKDFWPQFAFFIIALSLVSAFAMPLVFWSNGGISLEGLGFGLGASFTLYSFMGCGMYFAYAQDPVWS